MRYYWGQRLKLLSQTGRIRHVRCTGGSFLAEEMWQRIKNTDDIGIYLLDPDQNIRDIAKYFLAQRSLNELGPE